MKIYGDLNDYELVSMAQEHNEDATILLHKKYQPLIYKKCRKYMKSLQNKGVELSDLIQECMIGFEEAIINFNQTDEASFYTFANICMDRQLISEVTKQNRDKYKLLNDAIPLETIDEDNEINLIDFIQDNTNNPELGLLSNEEFRELYNKIMKELTYLEECVFKLKIQGFDYKEIMDILDKDEKSVYNTAQRIRNKIKALHTEHI